MDASIREVKNEIVILKYKYLFPKKNDHNNTKYVGGVAVSRVYHTMNILTKQNCSRCKKQVYVDPKKYIHIAFKYIINIYYRYSRRGLKRKKVSDKGYMIRYMIHICPWIIEVQIV